MTIAIFLSLSLSLSLYILESLGCPQGGLDSTWSKNGHTIDIWPFENIYVYITKFDKIWTLSSQIFEPWMLIKLAEIAPNLAMPNGLKWARTLNGLRLSGPNWPKWADKVGQMGPGPGPHGLNGLGPGPGNKVLLPWRIGGGTNAQHPESWI